MAAPLSVMQQAAKSYLYVVVWMSISMAVILFNKYILAYSGFRYPIALTMWHMVFCTTVATVAVRVLGVTKRLHMPQKEYINRVIPIGRGAGLTHTDSIPRGVRAGGIRGKGGRLALRSTSPLHFLSSALSTGAAPLCVPHDCCNHHSQLLDPLLTV